MAPREAVYALLSVAGLAATWYFNLVHVAAGGSFLDLRAVLGLAFTNPISSSFSADLFVAFAAFVVFAIAEARRIGMRRRIASHREWMIRMCAIAFGVSVVRLVGTVLAFATMEGPATWFASSLWIGFGLSAATGEIWIRGTRRSGARAGGANAAAALSPAG